MSEVCNFFLFFTVGYWRSQGQAKAKEFQVSQAMLQILDTTYSGLYKHKAAALKS